MGRFEYKAKRPKKVLWITDHEGGNYLEKVIEAGNTLVKGDIAIANVFHDDWCGLFVGEPCNCNPDVQVITRRDTK